APRAGASAVEDDTRDDNDDDGEDESVEDRRASRAVAPPVPVRPGRRSWLTSLVLVAAGFAVTRLVASTRRRALRVALLPFADDATPPAIAGPATAIGERVLEGLTTATRGVADIVGPRTTGPQRQRSPELRALARELDASYVLNAKHLDEPAPTMLVELIRVADGKHVWVRRYAQLRETATIAADIVAGASETLRVEAEAGA
ncbi:MAG: hypothetical protein KC636_34560, partial [Myxococcales bacterium]|nr:hypothetical protein [Myxococcales bacterium]